MLFCKFPFGFSHKYIFCFIARPFIFRYPKDDIHRSINMLLANTSMARLGDKPFDFKEHYEICKGLVAQNAWTSISSLHLETPSEEAVGAEHLNSKKPIKDVQHLMGKEDLVTVPDKAIVENDFLFAASKNWPQSSAKKKSTYTVSSTSKKATSSWKTVSIHQSDSPTYDKKPYKDVQHQNIVQDRSIMRSDFLFASSNRLPKIESVSGSIRAKSTLPTVGVNSSDIFNETDSSSFFTIDDNEDEKKISKFSGFQEEEKIPVTFVSCQSPESIFFRTPELVRKFIRVQDSLRSFFVSGRKVPSEEATVNFSIGLLCAVHHEGKWFRAEVMDIKYYPDIIVFLLDVGYSLKVSASYVHRLPEEYAKLPRTVLRCSLYGIGPLSETKLDGKATQL